jgi:hypothetical protein
VVLNEVGGDYTTSALPFLPPLFLEVVMLLDLGGCICVNVSLSPFTWVLKPTIIGFWLSRIKTLAWNHMCSHPKCKKHFILKNLHKQVGKLLFTRPRCVQIGKNKEIFIFSGNVISLEVHLVIP